MLNENCCCPFDVADNVKGRWSQTIGEVHIELDLNQAIRAADVTVQFAPHSLGVSMHGKPIIQGELYGAVHPTECTWTLENGRHLRLMLSRPTGIRQQCWKSIFADGRLAADPHTYDRMEKNLVLERFNVDNPAMDFSGADVSGNYGNGGPEFPE